MTTDKYIGRTEFTVEPFQEDFTRKLSWSMLGTRLLQSAYMHADSHGFALMNIGGEQYGWVLSRLNWKMEKRPQSGEHYVIETWVDKLYKHFTDRHFSIFAADGTLLGSASSVWALIGMDTRRSIDLEQLESGELPLVNVLIDRPRPQFDPVRIRLASEIAERELTAYYSDLDMNGHVNSIRYIDHILDLFSAETFERRDITQMDMIYSNEARYGDKLVLYKEQKTSTTYFAEINKNEGEGVCKARIVFDEDKEE